MSFRSTLLKLVIVVGSLFIMAASALPYVGSANLIPRKVSALNDCPAMVKAKNFVGSDAEAEQWCSQLQQDWIDYSSPCAGYGLIQQVFLSRFDKCGGPPSARRARKYPKGHESTPCERYSLLAFNRYVMTGFMTLDKENVGVMITKKVDGAPLRKFWKDLDKDGRLRALDSIQKVIKNIVHNFLEVQLINYGYPGIWATRMFPSDTQYNEWFERRWYFLWEEIYHEAGGNIPLKYQWRRKQRA
ncbi:hypothetical protein J3R30DRAFT_826736 [Lentinula aciculospora]|uniref:Secreted protein n=1 Tax=Lentinula aciculospora TaxID=153920 RepID=A0A9W9ASH4_9AGAR|nr:hypothetical protein J3R30DRAFT_826736 [Lentinula aciculospora]